MPEPFPHEHETPVDPITRNLTGLRDCLGEFLLCFRRQDFVGVEDENPFVMERQVFERPVFFLRPGAIEFELHDPRAQLLGDTR